MLGYNPPTGFHFVVQFSGIDNQIYDHQFQSVSGLSVDLETEEVVEGGENKFKHKIPVRTNYPNLVLKRGLLVNSGVTNWCRKALEDFEITPVNLVISLLGDTHFPLQTWNISHAYPVKWSIDDLNAEESKVVIETLELSYNYFTVS